MKIVILSTRPWWLKSRGLFSDNSHDNIWRKDKSYVQPSSSREYSCKLRLRISTQVVELSPLRPERSSGWTPQAESEKPRHVLVGYKNRTGTRALSPVFGRWTFLALPHPEPPSSIYQHERSEPLCRRSPLCR